jgi:4'-phosphopantetheinyl transferase
LPIFASVSASVDWSRGPAHPGLADGAVHVWRADLTLLENELVGLLSAGERKRAADLISDRDRARWSRSRGVLRELLGRYLGQDPRSVALAYGPHGKPELADTGRHLFFNLSHSGDLAFYAFTATGPVGLDVQLAREQTAGPKIDHVALARRAFGEDAARHLEDLGPGRGEEEFLRLWTRYEAELKWRGSGIGAGASALLDPPPVAGKPVVSVDGPASPWIVELDIGPRAAAALALRSQASLQRRWAYA